jgi:hypothetical protein
MRSSALALALVLLSVPAGAVELRLHYSALERLLAQQLFTQEGRRYVKGSPRTRCNFAYLEHPKIEAWQDRLLIRARFSGRSALDLFGKCVGLGDDFPLRITARPRYRDGAVALDEVMVESEGKTGFYIRRVCSSMAASLARDFRYPLAAEARRALEDPGAQPAYRRELRRFEVPEIRVTAEALLLRLEFELAVK